jgi:hypothetical protein
MNAPGFPDRRPDAGSSPLAGQEGPMVHRHSVWGEATDTGFLGGTAVAVLFLLRDLFHGKPLLTPSVLGQVLVFGSRHRTRPTSTSPRSSSTRPVHFLAFLAFGFLVTLLVRIALASRPVLIALVILFACFEVAFYVVLQTWPTK